MLNPLAQVQGEQRGEEGGEVKEPAEEQAQSVHSHRLEIHAEETQGPRHLRVQAGERCRSDERHPQQHRDPEAGSQQDEGEGPGEEGQERRHHGSLRSPSGAALRREDAS